MARSALTDYVAISPNRYIGRAYPITKITVHHMAGNLTVEQCGGVFASPARQASSNYGVGTDGRIACYVDEADAAWTSANWDNDNRAVTIEVANDDLSTWSSSDAAYKATVELVADICRRNGIEKLNYTGDASGNLTEHRMFATTACPGPWWHERMGRFAGDVNKKLKANDMSKEADKVKSVNAKGGTFTTMHKAGGHNGKKASEYRMMRLASSIAKYLKLGYKRYGKTFTIKPGGTVPVYKLRNYGNGDDMLTASLAEAKSCEEMGWRYEGVPFVAPKTGVPVYRLYAPKRGMHRWTPDAAERARKIKAGWTDEGVAFYADSVK